MMKFRSFSGCYKGNPSRTQAQPSLLRRLRGTNGGRMSAIMTPNSMAMAPSILFGYYCRRALQVIIAEESDPERK